MTPEKIVEEIRVGQIRKNYKTDELAIKMHLSVHQLRRRLKEPEVISVGELVRFEKVLGIKLLA